MCEFFDKSRRNWVEQCVSSGHYTKSFYLAPFCIEDVIDKFSLFIEPCVTEYLIDILCCSNILLAILIFQKPLRDCIPLRGAKQYYTLSRGGKGKTIHFYPSKSTSQKKVTRKQNNPFIFLDKLNLRKKIASRVMLTLVF